MVNLMIIQDHLKLGKFNCIGDIFYQFNRLVYENELLSLKQTRNLAKSIVKKKLLSII